MYVTSVLCSDQVADMYRPGWDTAGTESFRSITRSYYRGAAGCLLVYDVTSRQSAVPFCSPCAPLIIAFIGFLNARSWLADVREHADPHLTCILVGNKIDLCTEDGASPGPGKRSREVSTEEAELWAKEESLLFVEASAKSGHNVEAAFEQATRDILDKIRRGVFDDDRVSSACLACNEHVSFPCLRGSHRVSNCQGLRTLI